MFPATIIICESNKSTDNCKFAVKIIEMKPEFHTLRVAEVARETEECVSITFDVPKDLKSDYIFEAGQYITIKKEIANEELRRSYSVCVSPKEEVLRVAVKEIEGGRFSTFANRELKVGDQLEVMSPMGNFTPSLDNQTGKHYLLIAAGSGITPILSIAKTVLEEEPNAEVTILYGNKTASSVIFKEEIEGLKNTYFTRVSIIHVLSRENLGNKLQQGRISGDRLKEMAGKLIDFSAITHSYLCGPEEMILSSKDALQELALAKENIKFELFNTSASTSEKKAEVSEDQKHDADVTIIIDGDAFDFKLNTEGTNILEAGQTTGADLPFACKGGVCCTCKAKVLEGSAVMDVNYALEPDEVENGYILTCQAHPTSDKVVVSFDD